MLSITSRITKLASLFRHPLTILLIGTLLTSWLIPRITARIDRAKFLQEERFKKALATLESNSLVDRRLNTLFTALESFDTRAPDLPKQWREHQAKLRADADTLYREFDSHAWWWYQYLDVEALLLDFPPSRLSALNDLIGRYRDNLTKTTTVVHDYGGRLLSEAYKPSDPRNQTERIHLHPYLKTLQKERDDLARKIAYLFFFR